MNETLLQQALRLHQSGRLNDAAKLYSDVLRSEPKSLEALYRLGEISLQSGQNKNAERLFTQAIALAPQMPELFFARGKAFQGLHKPEEALAAYAQALALRPVYAEARHQRGVVLLDLQRYPEALSCFEQVAAERPGLAFVESNRAAALNGLARHEDALAAAGKALESDSNFAAAWYQRGVALAALARKDDALQAFGKAVAIDRNYADAHTYLGIVLSQRNRPEEALASFDAALRVKPGDPALLFNRAGAFAALKRYPEAAAVMEDVLRRDPDRAYALGNRIYYKLQLADWRTLAADSEKALEGLHKGKPTILPLQSIYISRSDEDQLHSARLWAVAPAMAPLCHGERYKHERPRVAYVSADFRDHAVARLMAGVFEHHDKTRFEIFAISLGTDDKSPVRARVSAAFEKFIDGRNRSDADIAAVMRDLEIDIAVDLTGYTEGGRPGIFAKRPSPLQVNYLGYPATMGAAYYDYLLADATVAPFAQQPFYTEKLVRLPHCYLPNDSSRVLPDKRPSRSEAGLRDDAFVFCAINAVQKIVPPMFDVWMRLLSQAEGSVLWLSEVPPPTAQNLRREAAARGVSGDRLLFAPRVPSNEEHLARLSLADLYLDTLPYNAHASACDALWSGVPMVTSPGTVFAGRVGASLLSALGMPELIAPSLEDYETLALRLARNPESHAEIRKKLLHCRNVAPLFDTARFTRNLEAAYTRMWERYRHGEPVTPFAVEETVSPP